MRAGDDVLECMAMIVFLHEINFNENFVWFIV